VPFLARAAKTGLPNYPVFRDDQRLAKIKKGAESYRRECGKTWVKVQFLESEAVA
jgi:stalled ribosome alternative rescue factor ArfA